MVFVVIMFLAICMALGVLFMYPSGILVDIYNNLRDCFSQLGLILKKRGRKK